MKDQSDHHDDHDRILESRVRPRDYVNPKPSGKYHLIVIGAGASGLVSAAAAAGLGMKVALIERGFLGGDCLNFGCVPSKSLLASARLIGDLKRANAFGLRGFDHCEIDFEFVMARMRKIRSEISIHDSVKRFSEMGVDVFFGQAEFVDSSCIKVGNSKLSFSKAVLCCGARPALPSILGLEDVPYLTNENLFSLKRLPRHLGIIGGGPIGCEMAQAFARFGSKVSLILSSELLQKEDRDAAAFIRKSLEADGVKMFGGGRELVIKHDHHDHHDHHQTHHQIHDHHDHLQTHHQIHDHHDHHQTQMHRLIFDSAKNKKDNYEIEVDKILIAVGRKPNVEGMNLDSVGVKYTSKGVEIDDYFRTTNPRIYAAGDVCSPHHFTHAADFMARAVIRNAFFKGRVRHSKMIIPRCIYTSPELAQVGFTTQQAAQKGIEIDSFTQSFSELDRAILEGATEGFARVNVGKGGDRILGCTIISENAGELIGALSLAMTRKIGLGTFAQVIVPYPTHCEIIRRLGDAYQRGRLTPRVKSFLSKWLKWTT